MSEEVPVARGAHGVDDRAEDRECGEHGSGRGLAVRLAQRWQVRERPEEPHGHDEQHRAAELRAVAHHPRPELGPHVDERRACGEERAHEEPDRDRDLEAGAALGEEDAGRPEGVQAHEPPGRHERERQEQHASVSATVGRLPGRIAECERDPADGAEDEEVRLMVVPLRVELLPQEQRDEPHQGQCHSEDGGDQDGAGSFPARARFSRRSHLLSVRVVGSAPRMIFRPSRGRTL